MPPFVVEPQHGISILGGATAFPSRRVSNAEILQKMDPRRDSERLAFAAEGLTSTLGVKERAWARWPGDPASDIADTAGLATEAAGRALERSRVGSGDIDVLLVATSTPHKWTSTVSSAVGGALGLRAMAFDIRSGCAGALFAVATAAMVLRQGARTALVVGADTFSKAIPETDRTTALLLADGAAALVLGHGENGGLLGACLLSDGSLGRLVHTPGPMPPTMEAIDRGEYVLHGNPDELIDVVPRLYVEAIRGALEKAGLRPEEVDRYVPQQAGRAVIDGVATALSIPRERVWMAVDRHANCGAASALAAWIEACDEGFVKAGDRLLLAGVGGGMSAAALVWSC